MSKRDPSKPKPAKKPRSEASKPFDIALVPLRKITVVQGDTTKQLHADEAAIDALAKIAMRGDIKAAERFFRECRAAGIIKTRRPADVHHPRLVVPKDCDWDDWIANYHRLGPPPWRGDHNGLVPSERT